MALNRYVVRVDPQGKPMDVDILDTSGASVPAFESSQFAAAQLSLPLTISAPTDFWLKAPGPYDVSCKVGTTEIASASGAQRVQVSDVPVLVVPPWEVLAPSSSGGSSAVGVPTIKAFSFAHDTVGIDQGVEFYTPSEGELLIDAWFQVVEAWNGTTPHADISITDEGGDEKGLFNNWLGAYPLDVADAAGNASFLDLLGQQNGTMPSLASLQSLGFSIAGPYPLIRQLPAPFVTTLPLKVIVSQDGWPATALGGSAGSTVGSAILYLVTAKPAAPTAL